jgi:prepilin-type processing-associated H-X9-DG protein
MVYTHRMNTRALAHPRRSRSAFTRVEILVTIIAVAILVIVLVLVPALGEARRRAWRINCVSHLMQIGLAFRLWAGDHQDKFPMEVPVALGGTLEDVQTGLVWRHFQVMSNELATPYILRCPADQERMVAPSFTTLSDQNVSYFIGIDATEKHPDAWLAGDRNLTINRLRVSPGLVVLTTNMVVGWQETIHTTGGNVLFADGSVQCPSSTRMPELLIRSGMATNRLVVP